MTFSGERLRVENSIDPAHACAAQGFLHGQNLLPRIAAAMGWTVDVHVGAMVYRVDIVTRRASPTTQH